MPHVPIKMWDNITNKAIPYGALYNTRMYMWQTRVYPTPKVKRSPSMILLGLYCSTYYMGTRGYILAFSNWFFSRVLFYFPWGWYWSRLCLGYHYWYYGYMCFTFNYQCLMVCFSSMLALYYGDVDAMLFYLMPCNEDVMMPCISVSTIYEMLCYVLLIDLWCGESF